MKENKYGEFDNFDDFFDDILNQLSASDVIGKPESNVVRVEFTTEEHNNTAESKIETEDKKERQIEISSNSKEFVSKHIERKENRSDAIIKRKSSEWKSIPFFAALFAITVLAWSLPLRPTESVSEKRNLERFPEFSINGLFSGDYFSSIDDWFSDSFTFRENWISYANKLKSLYGIRTVAIFGNVPIADAIPIPSTDDKGDITEYLEEPVSDADDGHPEEFKEPDENYFDSSINDLDEEEWGGIVIDEDEIIADKGAKLQIGDSIFVYPGFNQHFASEYAKRINKLAETINGKVNLYCLLVPENATSMLTRTDREKYGFVIEEDAFEYIYSLMSDKVNTVNVIPNLQKHNNEYIVFRSDHHWTARGAYYAYEVWCEVSGKEPVPLTEYKEIAWEDFFGTYYYSAGKPKEITNNPDTVFAYVPPGDVHLYLDFKNGYRLGQEAELLLDRSTIKVDQYVTFIGTDNAKATFINNDIDDDSAVLVLKDSFGNPFVYYLTQHYHYVYVVDYRYFNFSISRFIDNNKVDDVIIVNLASLMYSQNAFNAVTRLMK